MARYDDEGGAKKLTIDSDSDNEGETRYFLINTQPQKVKIELFKVSAKKGTK